MRATFRAIGRSALRLFRLWPLSFFGTLNLAAAVLFWVLSASSGNHAGIMLSVFLFLVLAACVASTHLSSGMRHASECSWSRDATLHEGENPLALRVTSAARRRFFSFTRVHLSLSGYISSAGRNLYRVSFECRVSEGGEFDVPLALPASGSLSLRGGYLMRDALGLSRKKIGPCESLDAAVLPRLGRLIDVRVDESVSSASRNSLDRKNESEKIFVREYAAGDLARDINWKALARTGALLTRIPPESPREERFISLVMHLPPCDSARGFIELDHVRALASAFLESVRMSAGDYGFVIRALSSECVVEPGEALDAAKAFLCGLGSGDGGVGDVAPSGSALPAELERAWILGSRSDPALQDFLPRYLDAGCGVLLSDFAGLAGGADHAMTLLSAGPHAFAMPVLFSAVFSLHGHRARRAAASPSPLSPLVSEFRCGVRP